MYKKHLNQRQASDHKITTTAGPSTGQSQVVEVAALIETNASNPSGKQKEDRA